MHKRWVIALALAVLAVALSMALWPGEPDPEYQGKKLSQWLDLCKETPEQAEQAIRAIGTNALPRLVGMTHHRVSSWQTALLSSSKKFPTMTGGDKILHWIAREDALNERINKALFGFRALGSEGSPAVPELTRLLNHSRLGERQVAAYALAYIGKDALAPLIEVLKDKNRPNWDRIMVASAMRYVSYDGPELHQAVIPLVDCLAETNGIAVFAAQSLGHFRLEPSRCIPALSNTAQSTDFQLRRFSVRALGEFGEQASPAMQVISNALTDPDSRVRQEAIQALRQIRAGSIQTNNVLGQPKQ